METRVVTSHLPADLAERLDRPKGRIVKEAISSYVALKKERHRMTLEALADAAAGARTITPESRPGRAPVASRSASAVADRGVALDGERARGLAAAVRIPRDRRARARRIGHPSA